MLTDDRKRELTAAYRVASLDEIVPYETMEEYEFLTQLGGRAEPMPAIFRGPLSGRSGSRDNADGRAES